MILLSDPAVPRSMLWIAVAFLVVSALIWDWIAQSTKRKVVYVVFFAALGSWFGSTLLKSYEEQYESEVRRARMLQQLTDLLGSGAELRNRCSVPALTCDVERAQWEVEVVETLNRHGASVDVVKFKRSIRGGSLLVSMALSGELDALENILARYEKKP